MRTDVAIEVDTLRTHSCELGVRELLCEPGLSAGGRVMEERAWGRTGRL